MIYTVKAYKTVQGDACVKTQEVTGYDKVEVLEKEWLAEGYDVTVVMECLKYIDLMKKTRPQDLARERSRSAS